MNGRILSSGKFPDWFVSLLLDIPWIDVMAQVWKLTRHLWQGLADEGIYEVLEYESTLELQDKKGQIASFWKRELVRYRQNNIIAYQDHAWGDGNILSDYHCSPGIVVDRYRPGNKTFLLISLRETKQRGDVDEFNISWKLNESFVREHELWETEVRHKTKQLNVKIIFPAARPPRRAWIEEQLQRRKKLLGPETIRHLHNGRWQLSWRSEKPRLNERYQLHWEW
jgi:hypothetical protein